MTIEIQDRKRVLFVDDERLITDTLVAIFSQCGYETKGVYSAEQALAAFGDWRPDLAVIDVVLPGMGGVDLAVRIKAGWPECQISLFSGHAAAAELIESATSAGHIFDVIAKPIHPTELLELTERLLGKPLVSPES